ncbi:MAG: hypothetical protein GXP27_11480 [Planctomycetes bacterium]|nr:hypothetical protein [Planctomycetota bacterium]
MTRRLLISTFSVCFAFALAHQTVMPGHALSADTASAPTNLVRNGGFEEGLTGWSTFWTRDRGAGRARLDSATKHGGRQSVRLEHTGRHDWSFSPNLKLAVRPGELIELSAWVRIEGSGEVTLGAIAYDKSQRVVDWGYGGRTLRGSQPWQQLRTRLVISDDVTHIAPRLTGNGPATVWLDDFSVRRAGHLDDLRQPNLPAEVSARSKTLAFTLRTKDGTFSIRDLRDGREWTQRSLGRSGVVLRAEAQGLSVRWQWFLPTRDLTVRAVAKLEADRPELVVCLTSTGELAAPLRYPHPFLTAPPSYLVVPMNEGISYPVDDPTIRQRRLIAYGGHGICMAFFGATDGQAGYEAIIETPDDASIRIARLDGRLCIAPEWDPQKGRFGYPRRLRYVFFNQGGHVALCKRYREYVRDQGRLVTFLQKRKKNPNVDLLIGAVNVWCWERDALGIIRELRQAGIQRILWSHRQPPEGIRTMNEMGILTSRYDIYQDVMNPANFPKLRGVHPDWTTPAWPDDLMIGANGDWVRGWRVRGKDGRWYPCGVLCDRRAVDYARKRIPEELKTHPYRCRFIDTTTASPWRECYHPKHPMTRSDSRYWKMELLRFVSEEMNLVTGSETGHDAAVPYVHYFEGMLSLGPYRVPDAGRRMSEILEEVPERVAKFQVGHQYRLPLWELVYHDCVVAQWYWGDYNNKLPSIWDKRDLFNVLYGTPPMFMFNRRLWRENRERFAKSYQTISPVARATGYSEMTDHRFLTPDRAVQQTRFANGVVVTVNFGQRPFRMPDGTQLAPMSHHVAGLSGQ